MLSMARSPASQSKVISTTPVCLLLLKPDLVKVKCRDEASTPNCLRVIPRLDPYLAATSSPFRLSLTPFSARATPIAGQLALIQEHQNIVRTTLCAPATLVSKLTFKSKKESSPLLSSPASPSSCPLGELIKP